MLASLRGEYEYAHFSLLQVMSSQQKVRQYEYVSGEDNILKRIRSFDGFAHCIIRIQVGIFAYLNPANLKLRSAFNWEMDLKYFP